MPKKTPKQYDHFGTEIETGDLVTYPRGRGQLQWGTVVMVGGESIHVVRTTARVLTVKNTDNVAVVAKKAQRTQMERMVENVTTGSAATGPGTARRAIKAG